MNYCQPALTNSNYILKIYYKLTFISFSAPCMHKVVLHSSCKNVEKKMYSHDQFLLYSVFCSFSWTNSLSVLTQPDVDSTITWPTCLLMFTFLPSDCCKISATQYPQQCLLRIWETFINCLPLQVRDDFIQILQNTTINNLLNSSSVENWLLVISWKSLFFCGQKEGKRWPLRHVNAARNTIGTDTSLTNNSIRLSCSLTSYKPYVVDRQQFSSNYLQPTRGFMLCKCRCSDTQILKKFLKKDVKHFEEWILSFVAPEVQKTSTVSYLIIVTIQY